jgi:shikimate kinase
MMEKGNNIILIGMPGTGKSTAGVILAKVAGYQFIDSDLLIQKAEGRTLAEIMAEEGTDGFIKIEERVNCEIEAERSVIATGGSVVYSANAMKHLRQIGTVVYLKTSYRVLEKRLHNLRRRGVVLKKGQTLRMLYEERAPLYAKYADLTVNQDKLDIEGTVEEIMKQLYLK